MLAAGVSKLPRLNLHLLLDLAHGVAVSAAQVTSGVPDTPYPLGQSGGKAMARLHEGHSLLCV